MYLKPSIGVLDLLTKTGEGIRNATATAEGMNRHRDRPPRYFAPDHVLQPYSPVYSAGQALLRSVADGQFMHDFYISHSATSDGCMLLVSHQHLLYFSASRALLWHEPLSKITAIEASDEGINLQLRTVPMPTQRTVRTPKTETMQVYDWLMEQIKQYVTRYLSLASTPSYFPVG